MKEAAHSRKSPESPSISKGVFALVALILILLVVQFSLSANPKGIVKGVKTEKLNAEENEKVSKAKERLQNTIEDQFNDIKNQVTQLDPEDVVQSSPQVQKIIRDLKELQGVPKEELRNVCENMCKSL